MLSQEEERVTQINPTRHRGRLWRGLLLVLLFAAGIFVGRYVIPGAEEGRVPLQFVAVENGERQLVFPTFWEAWDILQDKYIGDVADEQLFYGAVAGMVRAVGDPYTVFADPAETKQFRETIEGSFSGVGIEIGVRGGAVTVIAPLEGSPADVAGVRAGDLIAAVDDEPVTAEMTLDEVVQKIRGEQGSEVKLTVVHAETREVEEVTIVRDTIEIESVKFEMLDDGLALLTITSFNGDTDVRFTQAARQALDAGARGVIVDVRNNPGGFLQAAVDISSRFVPRGELVVAERGGESKEYTAEGNTLLGELPVVVLVNGGSASASEILAGALHDQLGAPVVGGQTFGKGSVQELVDLRDGSSIRVTIAKWFTPEGVNIDEEGITPTVEVEDDEETEDVDEQLERAKEELRTLLERQ